MKLSWLGRELRENPKIVEKTDWYAEHLNGDGHTTLTLRLDIKGRRVVGVEAFAQAWPYRRPPK